MRLTNSCICECGTIAITIKVSVNKREIWLCWKCRSCQKNKKAIISFEEIENSYGQKSFGGEREKITGDCPLAPPRWASSFLR